MNPSNQRKQTQNYALVSDMASARAASHVFLFVLPCVPDCWARPQLAGQVLQQAVGQPQVAQLRMNCFRDMHRADEDSEIAALCFVAYMCKDDEMITKALTVYSCLQ